jgi:hypothetical protein
MTGQSAVSGKPVPIILHYLSEDVCCCRWLVLSPLLFPKCWVYLSAFCVVLAIIISLSTPAERGDIPKNKRSGDVRLIAPFND